MNELPPEAASLLDAERRAQRAPEANLDRTLSRLHATLLFADVAGASAIAEAAQAASTPSVAPALSAGKGALFAGKSLKVLLAGVTLSGVIGGTVLGVRLQQAESTQPRALVVSAPHAAQPSTLEADGVAPASEDARTMAQGAAAPALAPEAVREAPRSTSTQGAVANGAGAPVVRGKSSARGATTSAAAERTRRSAAASAPPPSAASAEIAASAAAVAPAAAQAPEETVEADAEATAVAVPVAPREAPQPSELDLIDGAFAQLRAHEGEEALALLARHAALYPRGKFATEGAGLRVLALCEAGRMREGRAAREAFLERASDSPIAARVRAACTPERP